MECGIVDAMRRASASTNGSPATMRRLWAADNDWARISFLAPERPECPATRRVSQSWYQYGDKATAKLIQLRAVRCKRLMKQDLSESAEANGREKRPVYRPYFANNLTFAAVLVKFMAISDHVFVCRKLQFRTVQNAKFE
jgi:hypothetical protein